MCQKKVFNYRNELIISKWLKEEKEKLKEKQLELVKLPDHKELDFLSQ